MVLHVKLGIIIIIHVFFIIIIVSISLAGKDASQLTGAWSLHFADADADADSTQTARGDNDAAEEFYKQALLMQPWAAHPPAVIYLAKLATLTEKPA